MMLFRNVATWTLIICTLASIMQFCVSISCYQCRSDVNGGCSELKGKEHLKYCEDKDDQAAACRHVTQLFYLTYKSQHFRDCAYSATSPEAEVHWITNDVVKRELIVCKYDGCNSAHRHAPPLSTWLGVLLTTAYLWGSTC